MPWRELYWHRNFFFDKVSHLKHPTAHRRNSDSDSLASVEIEMESSTNSSEVWSPSKTRKRSHSIETLKYDIYMYKRTYMNTKRRNLKQ